MKSFDQWIESVLHATKTKSYFKIAPLWLLAFIFVGVLVAGGAFIRIISQNQISVNSSRVRFEPSSSVGGAFSAWVTSWEELVQPVPSLPYDLARGYTSAWNGQWTFPVEHTLNGHRTGDLYLAFNPAQGSQGVHALTMIDLEDGCTLGFRSSTDAVGANWNTPVQVSVDGVSKQPADYPSMAVSTNGTIVIGYNTTDCLHSFGFQTYRSINGGQTWTGPYTVSTRAQETFGRVVASGNSFHYLYVDKSTPPDYVLKRKQSTDGGVTWVDGDPAVLDTFTMPQLTSPQLSPYCPDPPACNSNIKGVIHYATNIDAAGAPGLGWIVMYAVARTDDPSINNMKFCGESLGGCQTISWGTDLFLQGVSTSASGDLWLSMHTYSADTGRTLPLRQIGVYRKPDGTFLTGFITDSTANIDPTSWTKFGVVEVCGNDFDGCFIAGDYMRIAMNTLSGASLPFIRKSSQNQNDLAQSFAQDPSAGVLPVAGLQISAVQPFGSTIIFNGTLPAEEISRRQAGTHASVYYLKGGK